MKRCGLTLLGWLLACVASATPLSLASYGSTLERLEAALERGDLAGVHVEAGRLLTATVVVADVSLSPDRSLFEPLASAPDLAAARALEPRLGALRRALESHSAAVEPALDPELFRELAAATREDRPTGEGFEINADAGWLQALGDLLRPVRDFFTKLWREFWQWLRDFFRRDSADGGWLAGLSLPSLVSVLVGVFTLALAVLAVRAWRARRRPAPGGPEAPAGPQPEDDDPLSRDAGGWRRYARELGHAGRTREAIRAWYHAVLVALYGRGHVSYRKGRTNWEVVAALSPALPFRPMFIELTRLFDREWYGLRQSLPEALGAAEELAVGLLGALDPGGRAP